MATRYLRSRGQRDKLSMPAMSHQATDPPPQAAAGRLIAIPAEVHGAGEPGQARLLVVVFLAVLAIVAVVIPLLVALGIISQ